MYPIAAAEIKVRQIQVCVYIFNCLNFIEKLAHWQHKPKEFATLAISFTKYQGD